MIRQFRPSVRGGAIPYGGADFFYYKFYIKINRKHQGQNDHFHLFFIREEPSLMEGLNAVHYNIIQPISAMAPPHPWRRGQVVFITILTSNQRETSLQSLMQGQIDHLWLYIRINALWGKGTVIDQSMVIWCVEMPLFLIILQHMTLLRKNSCCQHMSNFAFTNYAMIEKYVLIFSS